MATMTFEDIPVDSDSEINEANFLEYAPRLHEAISQCMVATGERPSRLTIRYDVVFATAEKMLPDERLMIPGGSPMIHVVGPSSRRR